MTSYIAWRVVPSELAQAVVDGGAVPLLVLCVQEPEMSLKRVAASALSDICKHTPELAQTVVDAGAIAHLAQMILNPDAKLKVGGREGRGEGWSLRRDGWAVAGEPWRRMAGGTLTKKLSLMDDPWWSMINDPSMVDDPWHIILGRWSMLDNTWQMIRF